MSKLSEAKDEPLNRKSWPNGTVSVLRPPAEPQVHNKDGIERYATDIIAENMYMLGDRQGMGATTAWAVAWMTAATSCNSARHQQAGACPRTPHAPRCGVFSWPKRAC
ncbi:hypothetical protein [Massilia varians]|uniref:hypothetical protein n=1 Tax=Massilia varians TaxID=457921 RepID=UPI00351D2075